MIQHVWERARLASRIGRVIVATPDQEIFDRVVAFGGEVVMTSAKHRSGTDRLAEVAESVQASIFVNIQGDEPLLAPDQIDAVVQPLLNDPDLQMASLMCPCPPDDIENPACVKVVADLQGRALYFSRARLPYPRAAHAMVMQHIGLYAYRRDFVLTFAALPPSPLEQAESLEQLRALENGYRIGMVAVDRAPISVDTPEDLERVRRILLSQ
jgi:3-deoxy-manno-octulosonate cytidylyltransferase (CMP-KDO synthetase)